MTYPGELPSMSYEPWRSRADIKWRMIYQIKVLEHSPKRVSENLGVSLSTVYRIKHRFDTEGTVEKRPYPERQNGKVLSQNDEFLIRQLVIERPGIYLYEIRRELLSSGTDASIATICRFLHKCGFTRTKIVALQ